MRRPDTDQTTATSTPPHPPRPPRPLHRTPAAVALVLAGGFLGAGAREATEQAVPDPHGGFPLATFLNNLAGAFALGLLLEALVRAGDDTGYIQRARLLAGTGFCGAFTTYSTFAVEIVQLGRADHPGTAVVYAIATVVGGLATTLAGITAATAGHRWRDARLPLDPDVDSPQ